MSEDIDDLKAQLDEFDPDDVRDVIIDLLRENAGEGLRALLKALRESTDPKAKTLYERFIQNPALRAIWCLSAKLASIPPPLPLRAAASAWRQKSHGASVSA